MDVDARIAAKEGSIETKPHGHGASTAEMERSCWAWFVCIALNFVDPKEAELDKWRNHDTQKRSKEQKECEISQ